MLRSSDCFEPSVGTEREETGEQLRKPERRILRDLKSTRNLAVRLRLSLSGDGDFK